MVHVETSYCLLPQSLLPIHFSLRPVCMPAVRGAPSPWSIELVLRPPVSPDARLTEMVEKRERAWRTHIERRSPGLRMRLRSRGPGMLPPAAEIAVAILTLAVGKFAIRSTRNELLVL